MNETTDSHSAEAAVLDYLSHLPDAPEARDLWARIDGSRRHRGRRRRAAATLFTVAMLAIVLGGGHAWQVTHQKELLALRPSAAIEVGAVQAIDRRLQLAYDRAATPEEIQILWQARALAVPTEASKESNDEHILSL